MLAVHLCLFGGSRLEANYGLAFISLHVFSQLMTGSVKCSKAGPVSAAVEAEAVFVYNLPCLESVVNHHWKPRSRQPKTATS